MPVTLRFGVVRVVYSGLPLTRVRGFSSDDGALQHLKAEERNPIPSFTAADVAVSRR
jgi:hypothetical protein